MSMWAIVLALLLCGGLLYAVYKFRRTAPTSLKLDELRVECKIDPRIRWMKKLSTEAREGIIDAFSENPEGTWVIDDRSLEWKNTSGKGLPDFPDAMTPEQRELFKNRLRKQMRWFMSFTLGAAEIYGYILSCEDSSTGQFLGAAAIFPPGHKPKDAHWIRTAIGNKLGEPPVYKYGAGAKARFDAFGAGLEKTGKKASAERFWYVLNLGTVPSAQGKGVGVALLHAVSALARRDKASVYLECHEGNVAYYQRRGFEVFHSFKIEAKDSIPLPYFAMLKRL